MKRILLVTYSLDLGGLERVVVNLANGLNQRDYQAFVCCIAHAGPLANRLARPDMLHVIGNEGRINAKSCHALYQIMRRLSIDIVHTHNTAGLLYGFWPARLCRKPIIHTNHGYVYTEREHGAIEFIEKSLSRQVDHYVCVSQNLKEFVASRYHLFDDTIRFIYNGIAVPALTKDLSARNSHGFLIGSIGNLRAIKNYRLLISAFASVLIHFPECRLELVGDGEQYQDLVDLCRQLDVTDRVNFVGHAPDPYVYLKHFDIFVLPSLSEGISLSILEALAMKKICLVSDVGGNPEIIQDKINGFLFKSNNLEDLVGKLVSLIRDIDRPELDRVREKGRGTVERLFSIESMVNQYIHLYNEIAPY